MKRHPSVPCKHSCYNLSVLAVSITCSKMINSQKPELEAGTRTAHLKNASREKILRGLMGLIRTQFQLAVGAQALVKQSKVLRGAFSNIFILI